jgi:hypothetical protein
MSAILKVPGRQIDLTMRYFKLADEPSLVDEYASLSDLARSQRYLLLRANWIKQNYGTDPGFDRVYRITTLHLKNTPC